MVLVLLFPRLGRRGVEKLSAESFARGCPGVGPKGVEKLAEMVLNGRERNDVLLETDWCDQRISFSERVPSVHDRLFH